MDLNRRPQIDGIAHIEMAVPIVGVTCKLGMASCG
jgi:hypothetical protein